MSILPNKRSSKVTLVIPNESANSPYPLQASKPLLGVGYLAAMLMQNGYSVDIIDAFVENLTPEKVIQRIVSSGSDIVGISLHLLAYEFVSRLAALCKNNNICVIIGGPEVTINYDNALDKIKPDVAVLGEGEYALLELVEIFQSNKFLLPENIAHVEGIAYRDYNGNIYKTPLRPRISQLDNLPFLPYEKFPLSYYKLDEEILSEPPVIPMYTSRGCPYNCSFCSSREIWFRKCFFMSAERVVDELEYIVTNFAPKGIYFQDDHFVLNKQRVIEICERIIKRKIKANWMCLGRAQGLEEDLFRLMKRAGCRGIWFGIESGSKRILSFIRKEIDLDEAFKVIEAGKKAGLAIGVSMIVGFPTQTMEEEKETLIFLKKAKCTIVWFTPYVGYPGSDMYRSYLSDKNKYVYSESNGIILPNSEDLTWPQKVEWARHYNVKFNLTFRRFRYQLKATGILLTLKKVLNILFGAQKKQLRFFEY